MRVVRLAPIGQFSRGMITPAYPYAAAGLIAQHDVVQVHTPFPEALWMAALCRVLRKPLLMTHHADLLMPPGAMNQFIERTAMVMMRQVGRMADAVTSYSNDYANHSRVLRGLGGKVTSVYPPVSIARPDGAAEWKRELGLDGRPLIGFAGRWVLEKGFDYLLQAIPLILRDVPSAHLVYAGETNVVYEDFFNRCQPLIEANKEHLTFLGLIRDPVRLANFYAMCDVFALPSRQEMMGLVQVESLLCGTPLVASDIPGARVVVHETGMGRLAAPRDPAALAEAIVDVLRNPARYQPDEARVRAVFDTQRSLTQYEGLMTSIVNTRRGA